VEGKTASRVGEGQNVHKERWLMMKGGEEGGFGSSLE
jgi:hypothetical protein